MTLVRLHPDPAQATHWSSEKYVRDAAQPSSVCPSQSLSVPSQTSAAPGWTPQLASSQSVLSPT